MSKSRNQKIAVLITFTLADKSLIINGIITASIFKKELCLVFHHKKKEQKKRSLFKQKLQELLVPVKKEIPQLKTSILLLSGPVTEIPELLADDHETILIIAGSRCFRNYSKAVTRSPVPFLFVAPDAPGSSFKKIIMPLDLRKENSDSALWCSWFGRFNQSEIVIVAANDKGKDEQKQIARNVYLTNKLLTQLQIAHKIYKGRKSSLQNAFEALELARSSNSDLLVILGSSTITPIDILVGLPERKIVQQAEKLPVLVINPRRDNYVLCD